MEIERPNPPLFDNVEETKVFLLHIDMIQELWHEYRTKPGGMYLLGETMILQSLRLKYRAHLP